MAVRLLQLIDSLDPSGGAEQATAHLAPKLVEAGVDLHVAWLGERDGLAAQLSASGASLHALRARSRFDAVRSVRGLLVALRPDLLHTTLFEADIAGRLAASGLRLPVVSSLVNVSYGPEHAGQPGVSLHRLRAAQAVDAVTARRVRRFHAISVTVAETTAPRIGVRPDRVDVVPRGRDPRVLGSRDPARRYRVRASLGLDEATPMVVAAARHEHQKGLDVLLRAVPRIRSAVAGTVVVVAGREGHQTPVLRGIADEQGAGDAVRLLGRRTDVADLLAAADVFVAPSRWEGLGSATVEAAGLRVPAVVTDLPALREVVGDDGACVVPVGDVDRLADAVTRSLLDPVSADARAARAGARFDERFTIDAVARGMLDFYVRSLDHKE